MSIDHAKQIMCLSRPKWASGGAVDSTLENAHTCTFALYRCACMCVFALVELLVASSPQAGSEEVETSCWAPEEAVMK